MEKQYGKVKFYNKQKGFGFIIPDNANAKDIFFHKSGLSNNYEPREDENVYYDTMDGRKGIEAIEVEPA